MRKQQNIVFGQYAGFAQYYRFMHLRRLQQGAQFGFVIQYWM